MTMADRRPPIRLGRITIRYGSWDAPEFKSVRVILVGTGLFAVHEPAFWHADRWSVTYAPAGVRVACGFASPFDAIDAARRLAGIDGWPVDFEVAEPVEVGSDLDRAVRKVLGDFPGARVAA